MIAAPPGYEVVNTNFFLRVHMSMRFLTLIDFSAIKAKKTLKSEIMNKRLSFVGSKVNIIYH